MLPRLSVLVSTVMFSDFPDFSVSDIATVYPAMASGRGRREREGCGGDTKPRLGEQRSILIPSYCAKPDSFRVNVGGAGYLVIIQARTEAGKAGWVLISQGRVEVWYGCITFSGESQYERCGWRLTMASHIAVQKRTH